MRVAPAGLCTQVRTSAQYSEARCWVWRDGGDRGTVALAPLSDASRRGFCDGCEAALLRRLRSECWHIFDVWRTLSLPDSGKKTATNFLVAPHILSRLRLNIRQLTLHLLCH